MPEHIEETVDLALEEPLLIDETSPFIIEVAKLLTLLEVEAILELILLLIEMN